MAELVDAHDSKSCSARSVGSIPSTGTSLRRFAATAGKPRAERKPILRSRSDFAIASQPMTARSRTHSTKRHEIRPLLPHLGQARNDAASALRELVARARSVRRARLRLFVLRRASFPARRELDVVAEPLCGRRRRADQAAAHRADGLYRAALSSAAARRRDRHRRSDARRPHGAWARARHQCRIISGRSVSITASANRRRWNSSIICARRSARPSRSRFTARSFIPTMRGFRLRRRSVRIRRYG